VRERLRRWWATLAVAAAGVGLTLFWCAVTPPGVLFSGDAGVKLLLAEQFSRGDLRLALSLPAPPWVHRLWAEGLQPFAPPYAYPSAEGLVVGFPPFFPALTAPFLAVAGPAGACALPALALWLLWWLAGAVASRLGFRPREVAVVLATLVLASPLTVYGSLYWEHTLGALLGFCAVEAVVAAHRADPRPVGLALLGLGAGAGAWVRPEVALFAGAAAVVLVRRRGGSAFVGGAAAAVVLLAAANLALYGGPLGAHGRQLAVLAVGSRLAAAASFLPGLLARLAATMPALLAIAAVAVQIGRAHV
jgi:hypothetical protein